MAKRKRIAKSSSSSGIMHLPEDVLVDILARIPLENLHEKLIFVCKTWATIILRNPFFAKRHALLAEPGLFLQHNYFLSKTRFLDRSCSFKFKKGKFNLRDYKLKFSWGEILGSSGGVALFYNKKTGDRSCGTIHVANPYTGYVMQLPPHDALSRTFDSSSNIAVIPCNGNGNGIVKVVIPGLDSNGKYCWWVLTVGVDISWRRIATTLQEQTDHHLYNQKLISVGAVMYSKFRWNNISDQDQDRCIHAIDLCDETTRYFEVPKELGDGESSLMEMGEHLCCIVQEGPAWTVHNVWILKDFNQNTWVKLYRIDVNFKENIWNRRPVPIGWLGNGNNQSLVFCVRKRIGVDTSVIVAYNVTTGKKSTCRTVDPSRFNVQLHKNTLLL